MRDEVVVFFAGVMVRGDTGWAFAAEAASRFGAAAAPVFR